MDNIDKLKSIFTKFSSLPYLFIGSGISRRYLELDDWEGLLNHFVKQISNEELAYDHYVYNAKSELKKLDIKDDSLILPMVASLIEMDFNEMWFSHAKFSENRKKHKSLIKKGISPFKIEVAEYIKKRSNIRNLSPKYEKEIELLKTIADKSINGIITTNYDLLIQSLFTDKDYETYVGQESILFSSLTGIRDIYKIHGCCNYPSSIVLTYEDYVNFRKKNAYLAAKLLTIFVEHPIIFLGYSIEDANIIQILESIVECLDEKNINQLKNRLFFVQRNKTDGYLKVTDVIRQYSNSSIPMKKIEINDFSIIYEALLEVKSKYNPRLLKYLQKDIYNLVVTNEARGNLIVTTDFDNKDLSKVDVVIGVGLKKLAKNGIVGISAKDIYRDIVFDEFDFLSIPEFKYDFVNKTLIKEIAANSGSVPIFKYIRGIDPIPDKILAQVEKKTSLNSFLCRSLLKDKEKRQYKYKSIAEVVNDLDDLNKQMLEIAILEEDKIDIDELKEYICWVINENEDIFDKQVYSTNIRRLIKIYDFLKYKN